MRPIAPEKESAGLKLVWTFCKIADNLFGSLLPNECMSSQTTQLTPNSNCSATGSGDPNNSTTVAFMAPKNGTQWFTLTVSQGNPTASLGQDAGNGIVIFKKGLEAALAPSGETGYNVLLTGKIQDNNVMYKFNGMIVYVSTGVQLNAVTVEPVESAA
jgi:hypothetical protein